VPKLLNITTASAAAAMAQPGDAYAAQAASRPLAGFGAGAFACAGAWSGSVQVSQMKTEMAALGLSRVTPALGVAGRTDASTAQAQARPAGAAQKTSVIGIVQVDSVQRDTHNFIQTALRYPAFAGGLGPHPAREPEPV
jgi:hypothetical protein